MDLTMITIIGLHILKTISLAVRASRDELGSDNETEDMFICFFYITQEHKQTIVKTTQRQI